MTCSWRMKITATSRHSAAEAGSGKHTCQGDAGQGSAPGIGWEVTRRCQMSTEPTTRYSNLVHSGSKPAAVSRDYCRCSGVPAETSEQTLRVCWRGP